MLRRVGERSATFRVHPGFSRSDPGRWHESGHRPSRLYPPGYQKAKKAAIIVTASDGIVRYPRPIRMAATRYA